MMLLQVKWVETIIHLRYFLTPTPVITQKDLLEIWEEKILAFLTASISEPLCHILFGWCVGASQCSLIIVFSSSWTQNWTIFPVSLWHCGHKTKACPVKMWPDMAYSACILFMFCANGMEPLLCSEGTLNAWREQTTEWKKPLGEILICFHFPSQRSWVWGSKRIIKISGYGQLINFQHMDSTIRPLWGSNFSLMTLWGKIGIVYFFHLCSSKNFSDTASLNTEYVSCFSLMP